MLKSDYGLRSGFSIDDILIKNKLAHKISAYDQKGWVHNRTYLEDSYYQ